MTATGDGALSVLLVDDTADVRLLLRTVLESYEQFSVVAEAQDGLEAIDRARDHQPDVVLLDLAMPRMGGLEALPQIRRVSPNSDVVVLSAFEATRMEPAALSAGAVGYLQKGRPGAELIAQLNALLGLPPPLPSRPSAAASAASAADQALPRAAHELRSPAIALNLLAGELARPQDDPEMSRRLLEAIVRQAGVIDRLTTDLLTASHAKRGALMVRPTPMPLRPELDAAVQVFAHQAEIVVDCPPRLAVSADQVRLEQMLTNLISNAVRYGSPPIGIEARDEYPNVVLRIVDHGPGVPDWFRDQLFDEYTRAEPGRGVGTGIGLFVVRAIAEAHGGRATYERLDDTTAFCLTLPQPERAPDAAAQR